MIILGSTSDLIRIITGSTGDIRAHASWIDNNAGTITVGRTNTASISTATTTTVVGSPAASTQRNCRHLNIFNNHATTSNLITIEHFDGTTAEQLWKGTLLAGESLVLDQGGRWTYYDATGNVKASIYPAASQAEMEAVSSNVVAVTPANLKWHPAAAKFWVKFTGNSTTILASYNVTSITDGTTQATITLATAFSSANWCCVTNCECSAATVAAWRGSATFTQTASTVIVFAVDATATQLLADPTSWHVAGYGDQ